MGRQKHPKKEREVTKHELAEKNSVLGGEGKNNPKNKGKKPNMVSIIIILWAGGGEKLCDERGHFFLLYSGHSHLYQRS